MNQEPTKEAVVRQAEHYFKKGYCCSEAILKTIMENFAPHVPDNIVCLASGLCGGMGNRKATCGVLTGGALALSLFAGRCRPEESTTLIRDLSGKFQQQVEQEFGASRCEDLLAKKRFRYLFKKNKCRQYVTRGTELLVEMIMEHRLAERSGCLAARDHDGLDDDDSLQLQGSNRR